MNVASIPSDNVINRIRKLMALTAERGATEAEAQLASEHVQRLLAEHNLSMSAVEATGGSTGEGGKRTREGVNRRQVYKWQRSLMAAIAELNYCKSIERFNGLTFNGYDLIGRIDNVTSCRVMFEYLLQAIERLARDEVDGDPTQFFTRYAHSFKQGCADRLVERLQDKQREMIREQEAKAKADAARQKHPGAAGSNLPAIILSDVIQTEADLNRDFNLGLEPGTTARMRHDKEQRQRVAEEKRERLFKEAIAQGLSEDVAYYVSQGYSLEQANRLATPDPVKPETAAQRRKREARDQRRNEQYEQYWRRQQRDNSKIDRVAYRKGEQAGEQVSLHRQAGHDNRGKLC